MKMGEREFLAAYEKYKNTVYSVIYNYVQNPDDAAELSQETFIRFLNKSPEFGDAEHEKAWLIRVAINLSKNHLRSMKHISPVELSEEIPYEDKREDGDLLRIMSTLPEKYRVPLHLFYYEEYSIKEIADLLDLSVAAVKIQLMRGKEKLKKCLEKEDWLIG